MEMMQPAMEPMPRQTPAEMREAARPENQLNRLSKFVEYVESSGNPNAISRIGASGLMGILPKTALNPGYGVPRLEPAYIFDPQKNREFGENYLKAMLNRYKGNPEHAIAAYNWGPGNTDRWVKKGANFAELPPDTQAYIRGWRGEGKHRMPKDWKRYGE